MCEPQTRSKYLTRNSPPLPANKCCHREALGNDGTMYISRRSSNGVCKWVPVSWNTTDKIVTKPRSVKKASAKKGSTKRGRPTCMARDFKGMTKKGTDGKMYVSKETKSKHWVWTRKAHASKKRASGYGPAVETRWNDERNNPLVPQLGTVTDKNGKKRTGSNWLGTSIYTS